MIPKTVLNKQTLEDAEQKKHGDGPIYSIMWFVVWFIGHFGQFVDMNLGRVEIFRAKHNTCLSNTNLGSVIAVNEKKFCYYSLEITEN